MRRGQRAAEGPMSRVALPLDAAASAHAPRDGPAPPDSATAHALVDLPGCAAGEDGGAGRRSRGSHCRDGVPAAGWPASAAVVVSRHNRPCRCAQEAGAGKHAARCGRARSRPTPALRPARRRRLLRSRHRGCPQRVRHGPGNSTGGGAPDGPATSRWPTRVALRSACVRAKGQNKHGVAGGAGGAAGERPPGSWQLHCGDGAVGGADSIRCQLQHGRRQLRQPSVWGHTPVRVHATLVALAEAATERQAAQESGLEKAHCPGATLTTPALLQPHTRASDGCTPLPRGEVQYLRQERYACSPLQARALGSSLVTGSSHLPRRACHPSTC